MTCFSRRWRRGLAWTLVMGAVGLGLYVARSPILRTVGSFLDVSAPPATVDYAFILGGGSDTRPFVAAALFEARKVSRILVSRVKAPPGVEPEVGEAEHEITLRTLLARGVPREAVVLLPEECSSTADEAQALARFLGAEPDCTVAVVTNPFHTRRARWIFQKALGEHRAQVRLVAAPLDNIDADNWWQTEGGFLCYAHEYAKLGFYWLRY